MNVDPVAPAPPRGRTIAFDALRAFAILTVVAIHCFMPLRDVLPQGAPALVVDDVLHYAVPLFVFISGALVWGRWEMKGSDERARFLPDRIRIVAVPYLVWALVFLAVRIAEAEDPVAIIAKAPALIASGHVWYHLYFVPMLFVFYALTPVMAPAVARRPELILAIVYAARVLAWPSLSTAIKAAAPALVWSVATHVATHLPHMALGAWFARRIAVPSPTVARWWPGPLAGGIGMSLAASAGWIEPAPGPPTAAWYAVGMAATVLGLAFAGFALTGALGPLTAHARRAASLSFGIYLVHPLVLEGIWRSARATGWEAWLRSWPSVPVTLLLAATLSFMAAQLLARSRYTSWAIGIRQDRR